MIKIVPFMCKDYFPLSVQKMKIINVCSLTSDRLNNNEKSLSEVTKVQGFL